MTVETIKDFAQSGGFVQIAKNVRENVNGYLFITFINAKNEAENIYFSKASSEKHSAGEEVTKEMLSGMSIAHTQNADGEARVKLIGNSERTELSSLL
jgi:hypothetical protein